MGPSRAPRTDSEPVSGSPSPPPSPYIMVATMSGYQYHHRDSNCLPYMLKRASISKLEVCATRSRNA
eukprot:5986511-Alexandrium_andersonii.AAC.1